MPLALVLLLSLMWPGPGSAAPATPDTTIAGRPYTRVPAAQLLSQLRQPGSTPVRYQHTAFIGPLDARLTGLTEVVAGLELDDVLFLERVVLDGVVFRGPLRGRGLGFGQGLSLLGTRFAGSLHLEDSEWRGPLSANQALFGGLTQMENCHFFAGASFIGAQFNGASLSLARCRFEEGAFFETASFSGPAGFTDAYFEAQSSFKDAIWKEGVSFAGARFKGRSVFWNATFGGPTTFDEARFGSETSFREALFAGQASFRRITFVHPARFDRTRFAAGADFGGSHFKRLADFSGSHSGGDLELAARFDGDLDLRQSRAPTLGLRQPTEMTAVDSPADSTASPRVLLQGAHADRLNFLWEDLAPRLADPDSADLQEMAPVYALLQQQLRDQGYTEDALACRAAGLEFRRQHLNWTSPERYFLLGWRLTTRYGSSLGQFLLFSALVVVGFALLYRFGRHRFRPVQGAGVFTLSQSLRFSLQTYLRVGIPAWRPFGRMQGLALLQGLLGWFSWALLIATLLARM